MQTRTESDLLGSMKIPVDVLYGIQTHRAVENFPPAGQRLLGDYPVMVRALLAVKQAAATANRDAGFLEARIAQAIIDSCAKALDSSLPALFPIAALHGGGGTSANMNANEILANLAEESLGAVSYTHLRAHET